MPRKPPAFSNRGSSTRIHKPKRPSASKQGYGARWRKCRLLFLQQYPLCVDCNKPANTVDHVIPHKGDYDTFWNQDNWQAMCTPCHSRKTAKEDGGFSNRPVLRSKQESIGIPAEAVSNRPTVNVLCGPPGSGKSTRVRELSSRGDLIIDMDAIYMALSGQPEHDAPQNLMPFALAVVDSVTKMIETSTDLDNAWIITTTSKQSSLNVYKQKLGATITVMETTADTCKERVKDRDNSTMWNGLIDEWFTEYKPVPDSHEYLL